MCPQLMLQLLLSKRLFMSCANFERTLPHEPMNSIRTTFLPPPLLLLMTAPFSFKFSSRLSS